MFDVLACVTQEHDLRLVGVAATVCVLGSWLTTQVSRRVLVSQGVGKRFQTFLAALLGGATIWSTHFIAMLAYDPGLPHGYEPVMTAASLGIAVLGVLISKCLLAYADRPRNYLAGGGAFGLTISAMHYIGMYAYEMSAVVVWDPVAVFTSITIGAALGAGAYRQIGYADGAFGRLSAILLMVLSICAMHFTAMSAISIQPFPSLDVIEKAASDTAMAFSIFGVTAVILFVGFVGLNIETSLERDAYEAIQKSAMHDALTGLPNRLLFGQELRKYQARLSENTELRIAVLTLDLNLFKEANDLHGHAAGDAVLVEISNRLIKGCGGDAFVARIGGDEFVAVKTSFRRLDEIKAFAERLNALIVEPINYGEISLCVGVSIGIATTLEDGDDLQELVQRSDQAMYRAKSDPARCYAFFNSEMDEQNRARLMLINDLRQALIRDEFELAYQVQNTVTSGEPVGFEVLLRWNNPTRGRVPPGEFIPLAEQTGLIRDIGLWVMRAACAEAASWNHPYSIAVNVAPQQLAQPSFVETISDILLETGLDANRLEIEVTEASIIDDQEYALKVMHALKDMGIRIAMDDFGTGYSSLATLQAFPFDKIKIDRSFIANVHLDSQRAAIVQSTLLLGEAMNIPVLAEGVESESELAFLRGESCKYVQGFLFGTPKSRMEIETIVNKAPTDIAS